MITEMLWFGARSGAVTEQVSNDIRSGNIAYLMNKPYHYTLYILVRYIGEWSIQIPMYMAPAVAAGITMVGKLPEFGLPAFLLFTVTGYAVLLSAVAVAVFYRGLRKYSSGNLILENKCNEQTQ